MSKVHRSAATGRFVKASTTRRHPTTTVTSTVGGKARAYRSTISGMFVKASTARRHPDTTIREGG